MSAREDPRRKVCVVIASRANYGRAKAILQAIREHPSLELQLVVGASALLDRFGNAIGIIRRDGFHVDATVHLVIEGENPTTMAKSTGLALLELPTIFENLRPDLVLTVADRYETIATAVAAAYMNIPLAHTQGGEVTGSIDESVRHAVTKLAHIHFPATRLSAERIIRMGEDPATVHWVGCPSIDAIAHIPLDLDPGEVEAAKGVGATLDLREPYLLVVQHPVTTEYGSGREQITQTLAAAEEIGLQAIVLWPNVDAGSDEIARGIRIFRERERGRRFRFFKNFPVETYARLLNNAACVVGNSSSGIREGAFLGVPAVNVGTRQAGRERGPNVVDVGHDRAEVAAAIRRQVAHGRYPRDFTYGNGRASKDIADTLATCPLRVQKHLMI